MGISRIRNCCFDLKVKVKVKSEVIFEILDPNFLLAVNALQMSRMSNKKVTGNFLIFRQILKFSKF